jgi:hypothetical protein
MGNKSKINKMMEITEKDKKCEIFVQFISLICVK